MNDDDMRRLFEPAEAGEPPPREVRERIRDVVHGAWQELPAQRSGGRVVAGCGLAAGIGVAVVAAWLTWMPQPAAPLLVVGEVLYATGAHVVTGGPELEAPLLPDDATVETAATGRVLIRLRDGALLRVDGGTRLTLRSAVEVGLAQGRVFADSTGSEIAVATPGGVRVDNLGTQFEVAVDDDRVAVSVREGRIDLRVGDRSIRSQVRGGMGEAIVLDGRNVVSREQIAATGAHWDWIHASMPAFELDGATVFEFLAWATAETGVTLEYANERVARHAKGVRLHGPPVPAGRIGLEEIKATLQTVPSLGVTSRNGYQLAVDWSSAGPSD